MIVNPAPFIPQIPKAIENDNVLRRRIHGDLQDLKEPLAKCSLDDPMVSSLNTWYEEFCKNCKHPNIQEVIDRFVPHLEKILKDPFQPDTFSPQLFEQNAPEIIQVVIGKMSNPNSLFYSEKIAAAIPKPLTSFEQKMQKIRAMGKKFQVEDAKAKDDVQKLVDRVQIQGVEQREKFYQTSIKMEQQFQQLQVEIKEAREKILHVEERLKKEAERLLAEAYQLREEAQQLKENIAKVQASCSELERASAQLQISIKEAEAALKESQGSLLFMQIGLIAVSMLATYGISQCIAGSSLSFSGGGFGLAIPF